MTKVIWNAAGSRLFETGVDRGVLYIPDDDGNYTDGVAWNGLTGVTESPEGGEPQVIYADNTKYLSLTAIEGLAATIEAYSSPEEFAKFDGRESPVYGVMIGQQERLPFGFSYRSLIGNDVLGTDFGYKIHLIYDALANPSDRSFKTLTDSPEALALSWGITTTPVAVPGYKPTSIVTIDSTKVNPIKLAYLEDILYGTDTVAPRMPFPAEVIDILSSVLWGTAASDSFSGPNVADVNLRVTDNFDGGIIRTWFTAGNDSVGIDAEALARLANTGFQNARLGGIDDADVEITIQVRTKPSVPHYVYSRYQGTSQYVRLGMNDTSIFVNMVIGGSVTPLIPSLSYNDGDIITYRLINQTVSLFVNGVLVGEDTDETMPVVAGQIGVRFGSGDTTGRIDFYKVRTVLAY